MTDLIRYVTQIWNEVFNLYSNINLNWNVNGVNYTLSLLQMLISGLCIIGIGWIIKTIVNKA